MQRRTKSEEMVGIVGYTSGEAKIRDRVRWESLSIAVRRRSIIRLCGDNYWSVHERLLVSGANHYSFGIQTTIHLQSDE